MPSKTQNLRLEKTPHILDIRPSINPVSDALFVKEVTEKIPWKIQLFEIRVRMKTSSSWIRQASLI